MLTSTGGVPSKGVTGTNIYDENLVGTISKIADHTNIGGVIDSEKGYIEQYSTGQDHQHTTSVPNMRPS